jgi:hypothetical protein
LRSAPAAAELCVTAYSRVYATHALKEAVRDWGQGTSSLLLYTLVLHPQQIGEWQQRALLRQLHLSPYLESCLDHTSAYVSIRH